MAKVLTRAPGSEKHRRLVFEGTEKDARKYIENNYPRVHVEPGIPSDEFLPDAVFQDDSGNIEHYHGPEAGWINPAGDHSAPDAVPDSEIHE